MLQIAVQNFRGIKDAKFSLERLALIGGLNGSGKSSIAQAVAAAVSGECPIVGARKADYKRLVRNGAAEAIATVESAEGFASISYPESRIWHEKKAPQASAYASGIRSPLNLTGKDAIEEWNKILGSKPTHDELLLELFSHQLPDAVQEAVVKDVAALGYDGAHAQWKESGARLKGRWEHITDANYGSKVAASWKPEGFNPAAPEVTDEQIQRLRRAHEEAIKSQGASEEEKALAAAIPDLEDYVKEAAQSLELAKSDATKASSALNEAKSEGESNATFSCPHCAQPIKIVRTLLATTIEKADGIQVVDTGAIKTLQRAYEDALEAERGWYREQIEREAKLKAAREAARKLTDAPPKDVDAAKLALERAEYMQLSQRLVAQAKELAEQIQRHSEVVKILAPDGLRAQCMTAALAKFNDELKKLSTAASWGDVHLESDIFLTYNGMPYVMLSMSEQYRVRAIVQCAIAVRENAAILIFDGADILTKAGKNGLVMAAMCTGIPTLIMMSMDSPSSLPKPSRGVDAYWLVDGGIDGQALPEAP